MAASAAPAADFWAATEDCIVCGSTEFEPGFGPKTLVTCDCCLDKGVHVECWQRRSGEELTETRLESPAFQWFCTEACQQVSKRLVELTGVQRPLTSAAGSAGAPNKSEFSVELVRWSPRDKGEQKKVGLARQLFNSSFAPLIMGNGRNLIDMVCEAFESESGLGAGGGGGQGGAVDEDDEEELFNFSTFRVLLLRRRGTLVSAATLRCFGRSFCEVPFVATRDGYRREGHCRLLMQELEGMLHSMGVRWVVVPAMKGVLSMWTGHFGYSEFSKEEVAVLEDRVVMPDPASAVLVRKQVESPKAPAGAAAKPKAPAPKIGRRVRFSYAGMDPSEEDSEEEAASKRRGRSSRGRSKKAADEGSDYEMSEEEAEEEEEEDLDGLVAEAEEGGTTCDRCGAEESEAWMTSRLTGKLPQSEETLCVACVTPEDMPDGPSGAAATGAAAADGSAGASGAAGTAGDRGGGAGLQCSNCGAEGAYKGRSGLVECRTCRDYRSRHKGEPRPERLWKRQAQAAGRSRAGGRKAAPPSAAAPEAPQPALQPTTPASRRGAGAGAAQLAGPGAGGAPSAAAPLRLQREAQGIRAFMRLFGERARRQRQRAAVSVLLRSAEEGHRIRLEQQAADQLGGHLLALVRSADQPQAQMQHSYEQQALEQRQALQAAVEQAAAAARRAQEAEALLAASAASTLQASESFESQLAAERAAAQERQGQLEAQAAAQAAAEREARQRAEAQLAAEREARQWAEASLAAQLAEREGQLAAMAAELARLRSQQAQHGQLQGLMLAGDAKVEPAALQQASQEAAAPGMQPAEGQQGTPPTGLAAAATGGGGSAAWAATASREAEPAPALPGSTEAGGEPEAAAWMGSLTAAAAGAMVRVSAAPAETQTPAPRGVPQPPGQVTGPDLLSPAASCGTKGDSGSGAQPFASRRRLTTGRSSGGARRRPLRSRPAPAGPGGSSAAVSLPDGQAGQQAQQGSGSADRPALGCSSGAGPASEDWGRMFGMLSAGGGASGSAADGVGVGDSGQLPAGRPSLAGAGRSALRSGDSPPTSPGLSLDGVAPQAAVAGSGGAALPCHDLGAALRRALGSQESRSQGLGALPPLAEHAQHAQQAQQLAHLDAAPAATADAVAHLAAMQLDELLALPTAGSPGLARPDSTTSAGQGMGDLEAAMAAAADIAQYLAD